MNRLQRLSVRFGLVAAALVLSGCATVCDPVKGAGKEINEKGEAARQTAGGVVAVVSAKLPPVGAAAQFAQGICNRGYVPAPAK